MAAVVTKFTEQAILLGPRRTLVGVIARPRVAPDPALPAVVILNTGIVHRVGHNRMYVTLSRMLAAAGRMTVRFDQSGLGDSGPRNDRLPPLAAGLADIKEALDSVQQSYQVSRFVLIGLCSGADQCVLYGHTDPRVVGLVMLDPTIPPTRRYYLHYILRRLSHLPNWISVLTGRSGLLSLLSAHLLRRLRPAEKSKPATLQDLQFSPYLGKSYAASAALGMKLLAAFTALSPRHEYARQILDAFPEVSSRGTLQLQYFPDSDHVFSSGPDRARLYRVISDWLAAHWSADGRRIGA
ncbi:MAG TPA: alpha/beta hydrolase [Steroidobacteraceae bacterium]|jgi:pimeloyl-ACP methyl ester carboxylesterase|nr:alpha/beta hydrolase [Steroidobacteraceae bacterium]